MAGPTARSEIEVKDGVLCGPPREPCNSSQGQVDSIHNDTTAQKLGFRGGTVAGSIHMTQFVPLMLRLYGQSWFERGGLSLYFRFATTDREAVQAFAREPAPGQQAEVWMDRVADGTRVLDGTAWSGQAVGPTALALQRKKFAGGGDVRILRGFTPGLRGEPLVQAVAPEIQAEFLAEATEPLDWYKKASPWGAPVLAPTMLVRLLWRACEGLPQAEQSVALFGAIEIEHLEGPIFVGRDYDSRAKVIAVGETPKSEYLWFESTMTELKQERKVARMLMMLRFMKQSSPLWHAA